jgi:hypothetical protein
MLVFNAIAGQSIWDICLNTYGSFDRMVKLLQDNNLDNVNIVPSSRQPFSWDEKLSTDQLVNQTSKNSKIIYATSALINGNVLSIVHGNDNTNNGNNYVQPPNPQAPMIHYQLTAEVQYTASGSETSFILSQLIGTTIIQITREIQPLKNGDYSFNSNTGQITLTTALTTGEVLYIIYGKIILS